VKGGDGGGDDERREEGGHSTKVKCKELERKHDPMIQDLILKED
jgi:hypothetical protein